METHDLSEFAARVDSGALVTPILGAEIVDASAWKAADFSNPDEYTVKLTDAMLDELASTLGAIKAQGLGLDQLEREHFPLPLTAPLLREVGKELREGKGFVVVNRLPIDRFSKDDIAMLFWGFGTHLGRGMSQSVMGDRLGHVRDMTRTDPYARAYRNSDELSPHTDSADIVGLACLRAARSGGVSMLASATTVHNLLRREKPAYLERLYRGYVWHRRGEEGPGEPPVIGPLPVFSNVNGKVSVYYIRTYVEAGMAAIGRPLQPFDQEVISAFIGAAQREDVMLSFTMEPGGMYFLNNRVVMHSRTAFEDYEEEDRRRHLLRLWLENDDLRESHPSIRRPETKAIPGRTPSFAWNNLTSRKS